MPMSTTNILLSNNATNPVEGTFSARALVLEALNVPYINVGTI